MSEKNCFEAVPGKASRKMKKIIHLYNNIYALPVEGSGEKTHNDSVIKAFEGLGIDVFRLEPGNPVDKNDSGEVSLDRKRRFYQALKGALPQWVTDYLRDFYNILHDFRFKKKILVKIDEIRPDMIFERITDFHISGVKAALSRCVDYVVEVHETHDALKYKQRMNFLLYRMYVWRYVVRHATLVVVVSEMLRKQVVSNGVEESRVIVLPNAVDLDTFSVKGSRDAMRASLGLGNEIVIGFVGGMHPYHGIQFLPEVCARLLEKDADVHFLIVGPFGRMPGGMAAYKEELESRGLADRFTLTGGVAINEVPDYIEAMDITIMPDSNDYGSPLKIFEYGAMRKPTVAPKYGPICEVLVHGEDSLLFEPRSIEGIVSSLHELASNPGLRTALADSLFEKVHENHTWEVNARRLLSRLEGGRLQ